MKAGMGKWRKSGMELDAMANQMCQVIPSEPIT